MRILFLSHYYPPEVNAPASRTYDHCVRWATAGHDVTVVTCVPNCPNGVIHPGYRNRLLPQVHKDRGIRVVRVWTYIAANRAFLRRTMNFASYWASATLASLCLPRPDVVVATSPQFLCGWAGVFVSRLKQAPLVLEIRDIWPESIAAVGASRNRLFLRMLGVLERTMYRSADHIVTVGDGYRRNIVSKVDVDGRLSVIPNGADLDFFAPQSPSPQFLRRWGLEGAFVCSYVGTIGMAHGLEVVIEAARILRAQGRDCFRFCLVGDGAHRARLEAEVQKCGLGRLVVFTGQLPKDEVRTALASSNACLIHLKKRELFTTVLPSKIFEAMAMARPIIVGVRGDARQLVLSAGAGVAIEPESADSLLHALEALARDPRGCERLGRAGRTFAVARYDRSVLASRYLALLERIVAPELRPLELEPVPAATGERRRAA